MNNEDKYYQENSISFMDMWHNFIDHFVTVLIIISISVLAFLSLSFVKGKTYSTKATLIVESVSVDSSLALKKQMMEILTNDEIVNMVSEELNIDKNSFVNNISISTSDNSTKINISYSSNENKNVLEITNSYANNIIKYLNAVDEEDFPIHPSFYETTKIYNAATNIDVYSRGKKYVTFGLLIGLLIGGSYILIISMNDNHFKNRKEVENLPLPLLGEIKSYKEDK